MVVIVDVESCPKLVVPDSAIIRELLNSNHVGLETNTRYSLAHGTILKGSRTLRHRLRLSSEVYYILAGEVRVSVNEDTVEVEAGSPVYIPPQAIQYFENIGESNLQYLVICDPAWISQDVEIQD